MDKHPCKCEEKTSETELPVRVGSDVPSLSDTLPFFLGWSFVIGVTAGIFVHTLTKAGRTG